MKRPLLLGALVAATLSSLAHSASAQSAQVVNAIATDEPGLESLTLIGESGQVYLPRDSGWSRDHAGGIAGDVSGAARGSDGTLFVVGGRAPLYELVDRAWRVRSLGVRRRSRASTLSGMPIIATGRQLFTLEGDKWKRIGSAPTPRVDVIWASSRKRIYLTDDNGEIRRRAGGSWTTVQHSLPAPELVERLIGIPRKALFAIGDSGTILRVGTASTQSITAPAELQAMRPTAAGSDDKTTVYLAGTVPTDDGGVRQVLASITAKGPLALVDELPALADDDRYSLIVAKPDGSLLVASYHGSVRIRAKDGSWADHSVSTALPAEKSVAVREARKPARTQ